MMYRMGGVAALSLWLAAGCGGPAATHTVKMEGMQFTPTALEIQAGDTVVWANDDLVVHTATSAGAFDSRDIAAAASWSHTFEQPAEIAYVCAYHPTMTGTIVVR